MERTRTVKRGYVVFGESITLRWGVELSWGNRALGTGKAGCGVRLAAVAAGFAGRAVVFFTLPAKVAPAILMHGRICLNWKPVSLFYHEFLLLHARHIAGGGQCGVFRTFHPSLRVARNPEAGAPSVGSV